MEQRNIYRQHTNIHQKEHMAIKIHKSTCGYVNKICAFLGPFYVSNKLQQNKFSGDFRVTESEALLNS